MAKKHILYLDGLKGVLCCCIVLLHYQLAFFPESYIGFGANPAAYPATIVMENLPFSLFSNSSFSLYVLFGIIAYLIARSFFQAEDPMHGLRIKAVKRYFRFCLPVFVITIIFYTLFVNGVLWYKELYDITGSYWLLAIMPPVVSSEQLLFKALLECYFENDLQIVTVLWCMHIIFIGSFLTFGGLALLGGSRYRYLGYIVCLICGCFYQKYLVFLIGVICADYKPTEVQSQKWGEVLILAGIGLGFVPAVFLPAGITLSFTYALAVGLFLAGLQRCSWLQVLLSAAWLVKAGRYIFSVILVHMLVLLTISAYSYPHFLDWTGGNIVLSFWGMFIPSAICISGLSVLFYKYFEQPSMRLADWVSKIYMDKNHCEIDSSCQRNL